MTFPARVYVTFARDTERTALSVPARKIRLARLLYKQDVPAAALCYVWARDLPVGTMVPECIHRYGHDGRRPLRRSGQLRVIGSLRSGATCRR